MTEHPDCPSEISDLPPARDSPRALIAWFAFVLGGLSLAWASGRLETRFVPDSPSYQNYSFESWTEICRSIRTPGYPLWLALIVGTVGLAFAPLCQVILHATASWWLWHELRGWGLSAAPAIAAGIAIAIGCTPMDHINIVATDAPAASLGVMTASGLLWSVRTGAAWSSCLVPAALAVATISIRPAYLFLIPWLWVAGALLHRRCGLLWTRAVRKSAIAALFALLPVLAWMSVRYGTVGEFAIAPFGHQNLAGVLVQIVSDHELNELGDLGRAIARRRHDYLATLGESADDDPRATMTIEARWDAMTYFVVMPAADEVSGGDVIESHRQIKRLNRSIVLRWPQRFGVWVAKAVRRGGWAIAADIVMHPIFLPLIALGSGLILYRAVLGDPFIPASCRSAAFDALTIVAITYLIAKLGFVSLSSPPIGRFSDAAAIFVPPLLAAGFIRRYCRLAG